MTDEKEQLPHQLLFDCEYLLQEIREKYPEALSDVLSNLKSIIKEQELWSKFRNGEPTYSKETADYWLKRLTGYENE